MLTFSDMSQLREKLVQLLLALVELASADIVDAEECHDAVDDEETILVAHKEFGNLVEKLHLVLRVDSTSVRDIVLGWVVLVIHEELGET